MPALKSIGILIPQFPGQTHIFFWREIQELQKSGTNVTLLSTRPPPPGLISHDWSEEAIAQTTYLVDLSPLNAAAALVRFPVRDLWADLRHEPRPFLRDVLLSLPAARRLAQTCKATGVTHVHAHSCGRSALIAALASRIWGITYSLTLHGELRDYGPGQGFKWRHAAFATVITHKLLAELRQTPLAPDLPARLFVQPMGVNTDILQRDTPYIPPHPGGPLRIFSCGRLNEFKGHQDLMKSVRLLRDRGIDATLSIAGEDDAGGNGYRTVSQATIDDLGMTDHITLLGAVDAAEVRRHLQDAHIFVLASFHEPLGVAYMEAMSMEVPTIGTDAGGVHELITHGRDGLLLPPRNPVKLADEIAALANNPDQLLQLSTGGRARVIAGFSSAMGAQTLLDGMAGKTP